MFQTVQNTKDIGRYINIARKNAKLT